MDTTDVLIFLRCLRFHIDDFNKLKDPNLFNSFIIIYR